ncbi:MAG: glycosyltransferase [Actinomycetota bacterium]|nr:glycosyltransferase [Actinomycetota bacterium]
MRILLISSMFPGPSDPDFGAFVKQIADELERAGNSIDPVVVDRRAGSVLKQARLAGAALSRARRRPDVVYAHYLFPAGAVAALAAQVARAPLVLTAHGRDVRNIGTIRGVARATRFAAIRSETVIAVSDYLRRDLVSRIPELDGRVQVIDCGVDLERFRGRDASEARRRIGWEGEPPFFLCVGTLDERKNVLRLADAFARLGRGTLVFVGNGPARSKLQGRARVRLVGRVPHEAIAEWIAACDVLCQPSLVEPFGQALLEGMASERPVLATRVGGPPEFVTPSAGVLVDPVSVDSIAAGLEDALSLPNPNAAGRAAAAEHDVHEQAKRIESVLKRAVERSAAQ